jgi:phosphoribulokinase
MSQRHPIIAVTGSSGAGTTTLRQLIFTPMSLRLMDLKRRPG